MTFIVKICIVYCVCLSTYLVVECDTKVLFGYQICKPGFSYCFNSRCRRCADLDGTNYGCSDDKTWRNCYFHCREKLIREHENEKHIQNQTWTKRFDELKDDIEFSNSTLNHVIKTKNTRFDNVMIGMLIFGLSVTSFFAIFLVYIQYNHWIQRKKKKIELKANQLEKRKTRPFFPQTNENNIQCKKGKRFRSSNFNRKVNLSRNVDPEGQKETKPPSSICSCELEGTHESSSLVLSEETQSKSISESELTLGNTEDNMPECTNGHDRCTCILKGVPIQESCNFRETSNESLSKCVTSNTPLCIS